jgi:O-antigen/teichoic acid export membrane protein
MISLSSILSTMVAARVLSKLEFATLKQTFLAYNFAAPILMLGLPTAVYYFLPKEAKNKKGVLIDNLTLLLISATIFSLFLLFGGDRILAQRFNNPDLLNTLSWMKWYPLYVMPTSIISGVLLNQNKTQLLILYNVLASITVTVSVIIALLVTKDYIVPLQIQIFLPLVFLPFCLILCFKNTPGWLRFPERIKMKEMVVYAVPLGMATILGMIMLETNKIVVSWMATPEEFANYVNGAVEIPLIGIVTGSIGSVILVDMTKSIQAGNSAEALRLFHLAALRSASILFPVTVFLLFAAKPFIITLFSEKYIESVIPFCIFTLILPIRIVFYGSALMALGFSKTILFRSIFDLLINIFLSIILVYWLGYLGAALATVLTIYLWTVPYNLSHISKGFGVSMKNSLPSTDLLKIFLYSLLVSPIALVQFITDIHPVIQLIFMAFFYFSLTFFILVKKRYISLPQRLAKLIPFY